MDPETAASASAPSWLTRLRSRFADVVVALVPFVVGVVGAVLAYQLDLGTLTRPGAGLWPFIASALIVVSALAIPFGEPKGGAGYKFDRSSLSVLAVLASLAVFIAIFMTLGFIVAALLSLTFWLKFVGHLSWRLSVGMAVAGTVIFHVVFVELLQVPFPTDVIAGLWGG